MSLPLQTNQKTAKPVANKHFYTLESRQHETMIAEREKQDSCIPTEKGLTFCLEVIFRLWRRKGKPKQNFFGHSAQQERAAQRKSTRKLCREPIETIEINTNPSMPRVKPYEVRQEQVLWEELLRN